ncbi:MAG: hypothetical protein AB7P03_24905 [Kofleriaceae bacterium]
MDQRDPHDSVLAVTRGVVRAIAGPGAAALFRDGHHAPPPVVPLDLHLVEQAKVDADGMVDCITCGAKVALKDANLVGSEGFVCTTCPTTLAPLSPAQLVTRDWRWFAKAGAVLAGIVVGILVLRWVWLHLIPYSG